MDSIDKLMNIVDLMQDGYRILRYSRKGGWLTLGRRRDGVTDEKTFRVTKFEYYSLCEYENEA